MYTVAVQRQFVSKHYLIGGEWGEENKLHAHRYRVEVQLSGDRLDEHGYLVDIVEIQAALEALVGQYRGQTLNELQEFTGLNPSIEHFSRIFTDKLLQRLNHSQLSIIRVKIWEADTAWAAYERRK
jgi:6-pyruvoyltetrahydropterin/6-carboxytetrahydropterin synthase